MNNIGENLLDYIKTLRNKADELDSLLPEAGVTIYGSYEYLKQMKIMETKRNCYYQIANELEELFNKE